MKKCWEALQRWQACSIALSSMGCRTEYHLMRLLDSVTVQSLVTGVQIYQMIGQKQTSYVSISTSSLDGISKDNTMPPCNTEHGGVSHRRIDILFSSTVANSTSRTRRRRPANHESQTTHTSKRRAKWSCPFHPWGRLARPPILPQRLQPVLSSCSLSCLFSYS